MVKLTNCGPTDNDLGVDGTTIGGEHAGRKQNFNFEESDGYEQLGRPEGGGDRVMPV